MLSIFSVLKKLFVVKAPAIQIPKQNRQAVAQARYRQDALAFAKKQHHSLSQKQHEQDNWQRRYGRQQAAELNKLSGTEFEEYLAGLFQQQGYLVELTPTSGDYGADLLLTKEEQRIAIQAKCYAGSVGVSAVQEALSGMAFYRCQSAWVVTTGNYTANAVELARRSNVRLIGSNELGELILQMQGKISNRHG